MSQKVAEGLSKTYRLPEEHDDQQEMPSQLGPGEVECDLCEDFVNETFLHCAISLESIGLNECRRHLT